MWRLHRGTVAYLIGVAALFAATLVSGDSVLHPSTPLANGFVLLTFPAAVLVLPLTVIAENAVGGPTAPGAADAVFGAGLLVAFVLNAVLLNILLVWRARSATRRPGILTREPRAGTTAGPSGSHDIG